METTGASRNKKLRGVLIVVLVIVLAAGAGVALRWWQNKDGGDNNTATNEVVDEPESVDNARSLVDAGQVENAEKAIDEALKNPSASKKEQYSLYIEQGRIAGDKGDYQGAITSFTKAYEIDQTFDVTRRLGTVYQQLGDKAKAVEFYKQAMELNPENSPTYESDNNILQQMIDMLESGQ